MCIARVLSTSPIKLIVQIFQTGCYRNIKSGIHLAETLILFFEIVPFWSACVRAIDASGYHFFAFETRCPYLDIEILAGVLNVEWSFKFF